MNNNYTIAQRNALVEKYLWCIDTVIRKNRPLMRAARGKLIGTTCDLHTSLVCDLEERFGKENVVVK